MCNSLENGVLQTVVIPRCGAGQRLACGAVGDICCDDREDKPRAQKSPPVEFGSKVERDYPHLEQSHQLQDSRTYKLKTKEVLHIL